MASSRSSSINSLDSVTIPEDLDTRARTILELLCNEHDFNAATSYIHPSVVVQHDDNAPRTSRAAFLSAWSTIAARVPDFHMEICEAVVDDQQRKVWVRSEISGLPGGVIKESIDMMTFDEEGLLIRSEDCQRIKKREAVVV